VAVILNFNQIAKLSELFNYFFPADETIQTFEFLTGCFSHMAAAVDDNNLLQAMLFAQFKVNRIMSRCNFNRSSSEISFDLFVSDDRDKAVLEWQQNFPSMKLFVTLIIGVDSDGRITQHGLGSGGGHHYFLIGVR